MNSRNIFKAALLGAACLASLDTARAAEFFLRAAAVTNTMPDGAQVVMWGFARDSAFGARDGAVTVPGPVLTVPPSNNTLTIRLDNDLPEPTSIVINGQLSATASTPVRNPNGRVRSFTREAAPGNPTPVTYSWTNIRSGTFLYLSGTHPQVQVQMGLYGALKKDTNNGVAYPGISYSSDLVLLFSEIDPVLHDAVATGNFGTNQPVTSTIEYQAKYFLINGVPFTTGQEPLYAGDPGKTNLLRFLNASLETHVPIVNGAYLRLVAEDGNPYAYPKTMYAVELPAQKTTDALLIAPAGTNALYDRRLGLVNGTNSPGGMLAYLSVAFTPPTITSQPASQTVPVGATVNFNVGANGSPPLSYQWRFNEVNLANGGGVSGATTPTLILSNVQPAQAGAYSVVVTNLFGDVTSSNAQLAILTLSSALDAPSLTWITGGNSNWTAQTVVTHDGVDAAQSGKIGHSLESWVQTTVTGPGTLTFWWKVSSQTNNDLLRLYRNGSAQSGFSISGEVNWQFRTLSVPSGTQTLRWRYNKNSSTSTGQDSAWLDQVQFAGPAPDTTAPAAVANLAVTSVSSSSATLGWTAPGDNGSSGTATSYDVRYSTSPITEGNFASALQAVGEPAPTAAGNSQGMTIGGLASSTTYYFALKTSDEVPNVSPLSNVPTGTTTAAPPPGTPTNLIALNSVWKYLENGSDQGTAWRNLNPPFNDSVWPSGPAELGYGDGGEATVIGDESNNYTTTYFRHSFAVANPSAYATLTVRLLRDDGGIVYLNGVEVFRSNMPSGAINYLTLASGSGDESNYYSTTFSPAQLVSGVNVIAVEIHQKDVGSSDLSFNLQLTGTLAP